MKKNTTAFKRIVFSLLFVLIIVFSLVALTFLLRPKMNTKISGFKHETATQIIGEKENTIDVLVLGDSLAYRSVSPLRIWKKSGITSYVCATPSQKLFYSEEFLHLAFKTQSPKIVLLETNTVFRAFTFSEVMENRLETSLGFFRHHNRWKSLTKKDITGVLSVDYSQQNPFKGFRFTRRAEKTDTTGYMRYSSLAEEIDDINVRLIKRMNNYCKKHGAKLVLYSAPSVENYNYPKHNALRALANRIDCTYIDMNLKRKEIPINWRYSSMDGGDHLNYVGSMKVSNYLSKYFKQLNLFEDKRKNPEYSDWDDCYSQFVTLKKLKNDERETQRAKSRSEKNEQERLEKEQEKLRNATGNPSAILPTNPSGDLVTLPETTSNAAASKGSEKKPSGSSKAKK